MKYYYIQHPAGDFVLVTLDDAATVARRFGTASIYALLTKDEAEDAVNKNKFTLVLG